MNRCRFQHWWSLAALAAAVTALGWNQTVSAQPDRPGAEEGVEVLTRGPVHEAFAETVTFDPEPGLVAPRVPPDPIEELPPEQRPAGDNVEWIPGYWAWDDEREDYLWVSGLWRNLPPGREWVAGYWAPAGQGAQWTSGYWADAASTEREYLPEPPATAEAGPNIAQPSPDYNWLPGSWTWQDNRYAWRPGFWAQGQQNWDWVPAHYQWTPRGYVFVDGYWDYSVDRRGVLFSPVYFSPSVYGRRGFSYSPSLAINLAGFMSNLFLRPSYGHYYFGDYYGSGYASGGFYPWFAYGSSGYGYDPFYAQQRWHHRQDRNWAQRIQSDFDNRRDNEGARPRRTWKAQQELITSGRNKDPGLVVATPYEEVLKSEEGRTRFQRVDQVERQRLSQRGREVQQFRTERQKLETNAADAAIAQPDQPRKPARVKLPRSPVVAKPAEQLGPDQALPKRHQAPEPDLKVEPKPRQPRGNRAERGNPGGNQPRESRQGQPRREERSNDQPQGKPKGESGGKPQGAASDKPGGASQKQPQGGSQEKSGKKPKE